MRQQYTKRSPNIRAIPFPEIFIILMILVTLTGCIMSDETEAITERTVRVEKIREEDSIRVLGNIEANRNSRLGFLAGGKIHGIYVSQGDHVDKGELLADLETARDEFRIRQKLDEIEKESYSGSPRQAEALKQELLALREDLEKKKINAPFDGIVGEISQVSGENYDYGTSGNNEGLIHLVDRSRMKATVSIPERDIPRIRKGQTVQFSFDAIPGESYSGRVSFLSPAGKVVNGYARMDTELVLDNPDLRIYPGYSFTARILVSDSREILTLERSAVRWTDDRLLVSVKSDNGTEEREIKAELLDENRFTILSGLKEGDVLVIPEKSTADDEKEIYF